MSTKQNLIADYLVAKVQGLFPNKKQLFNAYSVPTNNERYLVDGFGLGFGTLNPEPSVGCCMNFNQDMIIPLTKKFYALESSVEDRQDFEKELMDEAITLIKNIEADVQLGGNSRRCVFTGSAGIEQVFGESQQYIFISLIFNASFTEAL